MQTRPAITAPAFEVRLQARPESARLLRQRLMLWLDELGAPSEDVFALSLAVTEAFSNAVEHPHEPTGSAIEVGGCFVEGTITVTVRDFGSWGSTWRRAEGGYGLHLMRNLMDTVDIAPGPEGTSITLQRRLADPTE